MLAAILAFYFLNQRTTGVSTFDVLELYKLGLPVGIQYWLFAALRSPSPSRFRCFHFTHGYRCPYRGPDCWKCYPCGVLLKMGTYGFIRFAIPLFPKAAFDLLPLVSILRLSESSTGIGFDDAAGPEAIGCLLEREPPGLCHARDVRLQYARNPGFDLSMLNHGISTGSLFLIVGMIYERRHTRLIADFGGLSKVMPIYAVFFMIVTLSSIGLPGRMDLLENF